ncbi:hypothetical protein IV73_GL000151 [Weissella kandleri]|uniref:Uncharacterized protein n=1 Tax=Weissella kandleri TaxID=1616 RepID=A0A0R2JEA2_9LACO|nr:hypothetical protein [Weissella kandleri]KRN75659.1 hypothetical protein IV73_GL000151 [Weissella kandleri]
MIKGGSGGEKTNLNGLTFENSTDLVSKINDDLSDKYEIKEHIFPKSFKSVFKKNKNIWDVYRKDEDKKIGIITKKKQFYNVLREIYNLENIHSKTWEPDEAFFNLERGTVFIVEKKFQTGPGSVDEKLFGFNAKRIIYQEIFNQEDKEPNIPIEFATLLNSSYWLHRKYKDENGVEKVKSNYYHDYFNSLRNNGIRIMFDKYDYWWFGL